MLSLALLVLTTQATIVYPVPQQQPSKNVFILAGQSNMAGRGGVVNPTKTGKPTWDGIVPPQCQPNPSIFRLSAGLSWDAAHEPLHADIDYNKTNGIGPGMAFANAVLTKDPEFGLVGLVPCAVGGTTIRQWAKGGFLYEQLVKRAREALVGGGILRAMLWYQGEADTIDRDDADAYRGRLEKFFVDLRADLPYANELPIFQVALGSGQGLFVETVREAQLGLDLSNVQCIDARGLPLEPDRLHLSTPAQVKLGQMLADAFLHSIQTPNSIPTIQTPSSIPTSNSSPRRFYKFISDFFLIGPLLISLLIKL